MLPIAPRATLRALATVTLARTTINSMRRTTIALVSGVLVSTRKLLIILFSKFDKSGWAESQQ